MGRHRPKTAAETSALDAVGEEIVAIVAPVSVCMMCCAFLVRLLRVEGEDVTAEMQGGIASAAYQENADDSIATKAGGAVLNSLVFVAFITCATFGIFFLFKHNCTKVIWAYMGFSGLLIFGMLGAIVGMEVLQALNIPIDLLTFFFCVWNFSIVGVLVVFFWPAPLLVKQSYLVNLGAVVAFSSPCIPEWTTWVLLVAMAIYDLFAVLTPGGPLRVLVALRAGAKRRHTRARVRARDPCAAPRDNQPPRHARGILEAMMAAPRTTRAGFRGLAGDDEGTDRTRAGAGGHRRAAGDPVGAEADRTGVRPSRGCPRGAGEAGRTPSRSRAAHRGGRAAAAVDRRWLTIAIATPVARRWGGRGRCRVRPPAPPSSLGLGDFIFYSGYAAARRATCVHDVRVLPRHRAGTHRHVTLLGFAQKARRRCRYPSRWAC